MKVNKTASQLRPAAVSIPLLSIVMPVYNGATFLHQSIASILNQTFTDYEFIVLNDGSIDASLEILRRFADPRIKVIDLPHRGLVPTLNSGLELAHGLYVARMDADDVASPTRFARQLIYFKEHPHTVLVGTCARLIDSLGLGIGQCITPPIDGKRLAIALCGSNQFVHGSVMMNRHAVTIAGGYRSEFCTAEDYDLWLRLAEVGVVANIPKYLYGLRVHPASKTQHEGAHVGQVESGRARLYAWQRRWRGSDDLEYSSASSQCLLTTTIDNGLIPSSEKVTFLEWAQIWFWLRDFKLSFTSVKLALNQNYHRSVIVPPLYLTQAYLRELMMRIGKRIRR